ncbi:MAG: tRNA (N6-isopentenyl adenosine(37)-C2)-methylthiotransferase MiaB [Pseudomonadota bacterium]
MARFFHIVTMGCQMNEYDADYLGQALVNLDYLPTESPNLADVILVNTCTVRAKAEQKAFSLIGRLTSLKKRRPDLILGVAGCIAQQEGERLFNRFPELDMVLGTREIYRFKELFDRVCRDREKIVATDICLEPLSPLEGSNGYFKGRVKGYISIMQGCNNFCSYCIVPFVRGRETSRPPDDILKEAERLISQGVKEITLLGQNVNSYYWGGREGARFPGLLEKLSKLEGLARIRFTTSHPKDLSEALIQSYGVLDRLCSHIHLPFQAGSNRILKSMNRGYTRDKYLELVSKLRDVRSDISITSDVMVGFPGETDKDFQSTLDLIREVEFDSLFSFKYSDRKGTLAAKMGGKISEDEKAARLSFLQQLQKGITLNRNRMLEGREVEILLEGVSKRGGQLTGRTQTNKVVNLSSDNILIGQLVKVRIKHGYINSLWGELIGVK